MLPGSKSLGLSNKFSASDSTTGGDYKIVGLGKKMKGGGAKKTSAVHPGLTQVVSGAEAKSR